MQCGLVGDGKLVRPHCKAPPLLDPSDAPLDGIALFVCLSVEAGRAASGAASPQAVADLVGGLRDNGTDAASTEMPTDRAGGVGAIARTTAGRVLGLPSPLRGIRIPAMTASNAGASPAWPAVTWMDRGRARLSLAKWTFVLNPPRERPSA